MPVAYRYDASAEVDAAAVGVSAVATPFGSFFIASCKDAIIATDGPHEGRSDPIAWALWRYPGRAVVAAAGEHAEARRQVEAYFGGVLRRFELSLALNGSELDRLVWGAACEIPFGRSMTYGELALDAGAPGRARAVGRAMRLCPTPLLVPCHRVVGADGRPHGDTDSWERRERLRHFEIEILRSGRQ